MAGHSCHRIFGLFQSCRAGRNIDEGIIGYAVFVHAVECQCISLWRPEDTGRDTELVPVYVRCAERDLVVVVVCDRHTATVVPDEDKVAAIRYG